MKYEKKISYKKIAKLFHITPQKMPQLMSYYARTMNQRLDQRDILANEKEQKRIKRRLLVSESLRCLRGKVKTLAMI
jgi:hypothetical protein